MGDGNKKTVNIRVDASDWEAVDGNRSEICRQALRAAAEMSREAGDVMHYAKEYEDALSELDELEAEVRVKRQLLYEELETWDYDEYILGEIEENMATFEETVLFASEYAETYLEADKTEEQTVKLIRRDMNEEGRQLPKGVAEWIVERVQDELG